MPANGIRPRLVSRVLRAWAQTSLRYPIRMLSFVTYNLRIGVPVIVIFYFCRTPLPVFKYIIIFLSPPQEIRIKQAVSGLFIMILSVIGILSKILPTPLVRGTPKGLGLMVRRLQDVIFITILSRAAAEGLIVMVHMLHSRITWLSPRTKIVMQTPGVLRRARIFPPTIRPQMGPHIGVKQVTRIISRAIRPTCILKALIRCLRMRSLIWVHHITLTSMGIR